MSDVVVLRIVWLWRVISRGQHSKTRKSSPKPCMSLHNRTDIHLMWRYISKGSTRSQVNACFTRTRTFSTAAESSAMASATRIVISPQSRPELAVADLQTSSADKASALLQENHEKHHIFYNVQGFHVCMFRWHKNGPIRLIWNAEPHCT